MHSDTIDKHRHDHGVSVHARHESRTRWVVVITAVMMVGELIVGRITNSMALTADGWHMGSHTGALGLSLFGYWIARTRARDSAFSFGTGKVYAVAGYTSAVALTLVALFMLVESGARLFEPLPISFDQALPVAVLGLLVNLASAGLLHVGHDHAHDMHASAHEHDVEVCGGDDHNLQAAYLHVLADALTSVLAIAALVGGRYLGWSFLDPVMGIVGALVIMKWGLGLCRSAGRQLLDTVPSQFVLNRIRDCIESIGDAKVSDLHLWEIGPGQRACIVSLVTSNPEQPSFYRHAIAEVASVAHVTIEVERCPGQEHHGSAS